MIIKKALSGFTLVELVTVLVILGIVSAIGSSFVISTTDSYNQVQERTKLTSRGRLAIEQMARQLRIAVPNSIRVSGTGNCVEFLPVVAGVRYINDVPDEENGMLSTSSITTFNFSLGLGSANHVVFRCVEH